MKIHVDPTVLVGIQETGPSSFNVVENSGAEFGAQLWYKFIDKMISAGITPDKTMYGVSWPADDQTPPQIITYFCGFESDQDIDGFDSLNLNGGNYFQYNAEVLAVDMDKAFQDAYMKALPASGLKAREGQHLEIYGDEYDPDSPVAKFKILIPVE